MDNSVVFQLFALAGRDVGVPERGAWSMVRHDGEILPFRDAEGRPLRKTDWIRVHSAGAFLTGLGGLLKQLSEDYAADVADPAITSMLERLLRKQARESFPVIVQSSNYTSSPAGVARGSVQAFRPRVRPVSTMASRNEVGRSMGVMVDSLPIRLFRHPIGATVRRDARLFHRRTEWAISRPHGARPHMPIEHLVLSTRAGEDLESVRMGTFPAQHPLDVVVDGGLVRHRHVNCLHIGWLNPKLEGSDALSHGAWLSSVILWYDKVDGKLVGACCHDCDFENGWFNVREQAYREAVHECLHHGTRVGDC